MSKDTFKYYQSTDRNKPSDKTIKLYLKSKKLNKLQLGILFKSLREYYILSLKYDFEDFYGLHKDESIEDEFLRNNMKDIKIIDDDRINKTNHDFNKQRAYENLRKFKTRMIILIQLLLFCLIYYFSKNLILAITSTVAIELIVSISNKQPTEKDFRKAKEEMDSFRNSL